MYQKYNFFIKILKKLKDSVYFCEKTSPKQQILSKLKTNTMSSLTQLANQLEDLKRQQLMVEEALKKEEEKIKRESNPDIDRYETLVNEIESTLRSGIVSKRDPQGETRRLIQLTIQPFLHNILKVVKTQDLKIHELNIELRKLKAKKD